MSQRKHKVVNLRNKDTKKNVVSDHLKALTNAPVHSCRYALHCHVLQPKELAFTVSPTSTVRMCVWVCICLCTGHPDTKNRKVSTNR